MARSLGATQTTLPVAAISDAGSKSGVHRGSRLQAPGARLRGCEETRRAAEAQGFQGWRTVAYGAGRSAGLGRVMSKQVCQGFVGESTPPAAQYHCNDFEWETLRDEAEALLHERAEAAASEAAGPPSSTDSDWEHKAESWESFHSAHSTARFFKEKRYLLLEFPVLADDTKPQHVLEIGCGCGSSILPILKSNQAATATVCDVSQTAVRLLGDAAESAGIDWGRITGFAADASTPEGAEALAGLSADSCLLIFTLSAVMPGANMHAVLRAAYDALSPGGVLLFRDYALYDMPQLRFPEEQRLGDRLYRRLDGTLSYFFTTEDLSSRAEEAGFETEECSYACVLLKNRKTGAGMKRAFVHGVFRKPHVQREEVGAQ